MALPNYASPLNRKLEPTTTATPVRPQARITIATRDAVYGPDGTAQDPNLSLVDVTTGTQLTSIPGSFTITLVARNVVGTAGWQDLLNAMDFVTIELRGDAADPWTTVMVGFIDSVSLSQSASSSGGQRLVQIKGSDFGKILADSTIDFWPMMASVNLTSLVGEAVGTIPLYAHPTVADGTVGMLSAGTTYPVVEQLPGWVKLSLSYASLWAQSSQLRLQQVVNPQAQQLYQDIQAYGITTPITGSITASGLGALLLNVTSSTLLAPAQLNTDPGTLMALVFAVWLFRVWNVPLGYANSSGHFTAAYVSDVFHFLCTLTDGIYSQNALMSPVQGSVLNFFQSISFTPTYELWVDTRSVEAVNGYLTQTAEPISQTYDSLKSVFTTTVINGDTAEQVPVRSITFGETPSVPVMMFRKAPFDAATFATLPQHKISNHEIKDMKITKSDTDVINLYYVYPEAPMMSTSNVPQAIAVSYWPLFDGASATRYGMRELRTAWNGVPTGQGGLTGENLPAGVALPSGITVAELSGAFGYFLAVNDELYTWYNKNPFYFSGTYTLIRGRPDIRIGDMLVDESTGLSYYIEGVQHTFTQFQSFVTSVTVSRGELRSL